MCLADGTPIATISTRAKDGTWVRTGWLNLATGGFTAGAPPTSARPCVDSQDNGGGEDDPEVPPSPLVGVHVENWCDTDDNGDVLSPVLAKYVTDDDGAITDVEFLTPDGQPYEVQGTLGICDTDTGEVVAVPRRELVRLCDTADDGAITVFVRDYERDENGDVTGYTDYTLDGEPYVPSGVVASCDVASADMGEECASPTTPVATTGLCLADGTPIAVTVERDCDGVVTRTGWIDLSTGTYSEGQYPDGTRACGETSAFDVSGVLCDVNDDGDVLGLVLIEVERGTDGEITGTRLINPADGSEYTLQGELTVCPAGVDQPEKDLITLCDVTEDGEGTTATRFLRDYTRDENGAIVGYTDYDLDGQPYTPTGEVVACDDVPVSEEPDRSERDLIRLCDTVDEGEDTTVTVFVRDYERDNTGNIVGHTDYTLDGELYTPVGQVGACEEALQAPEREHDLVRLCDVVDSGEDVETVAFIRDYTRDENGGLVGYTDYTLDGDPYSPSGVVEFCSDTTPSEPCRSTHVLMLCDLADVDEQPAVTAETEPPTGDANAPLDGAQTLFDGGELVFPGDPDGSEGDGTQVYRAIAGTVTADMACGDSGRVMVSVRVRQDGPGAGAGSTGGLWLYKGDEVAEIARPVNNTPVGHEQVLSATTTATADEIASGAVRVVLRFETWQNTSKSWTVDQYQATVTPQCPAPFMRTVVADCETGAIVSTVDTTLDGEPYEVTGEVGQCQTTSGGGGGGGGHQARFEVEGTTVCVLDTDGGMVRQARAEHVYDTATGDLTETRYVDPVTGEPVELDEGETIGVCDSGDGPGPEPQDRFEVEQVTACVLDADGDVFRQVLVEHVFDTATGERTDTRLVEPVTGEPVELGEGESVGECVQPFRGTLPMLLCDTIDDGEGVEIVTFLRSYQIDSTGGQVAGYVDTLVDGTTPYEPQGEIGVCGPDNDPDPDPLGKYSVEQIAMCVLDTDGGVVRHVMVEHIFDTTTGERVDTRTVDPVTGEPVELDEGQTLGKCVQPCRNTSSLMLCETSDEGQSSGELTATDIDDPTVFNVWEGYGSTPPDWCLEPGDSGTLWEGGEAILGPGTECSVGAEGTHETIAATLTNPGVDCEDVTVTASVRVTNDGPNPGYVGNGQIALWNTRTEELLASTAVTRSAPVGHTETVTITAAVSGDDLSAGNVAFSIDLETEHYGAKSWTVDEFGATFEGTCETPTQVLSNVVTDCETGEVVSVTYTTLDGEPYTPTGEISQCEPIGSGDGPETSEVDAAPVVLCDTVDTGEDVEVIEFLRSYRVDNSTGQITGYADTMLNGRTPYTPSGEVGTCATSVNGSDTEPVDRLDVETEVLCVLNTDGDRVREVRVERVYDDQTGELVEQRIMDPTTDEPYTLADGETLGLCPDCPVAFSTECVAVVTRSPVSYDNTAMIGGVPGECGSVVGPVDTQNPEDGAQFGCQGGPYRITSWIIDGQDVITGEPPSFVGGPCGPGDETEPGMHTNWAALLTNLDPYGAWEVDEQTGCAWFVRSDAPRPVEYGPMIIEGNGRWVQDGLWTLGPAQSCEETQYTKVYSQDCDGTVSVSWLDAQGNPTDPPEGELVPCGTGCQSSGGGGGCCEEPSADIRCETFVLCDTGPDGDDPVSFMRAICRDASGTVVSVTDTELDAVTPYTVRS